MKRLNIKFPITCKTGEVAENYRDYLKTKHWADMRIRFKNAKYPKECNVCKTTDATLELHHKTYKRIGKEYLWDLIYLCRNCHQKTHDKYKKQTSSRANLWSAHKRISKGGQPTQKKGTSKRGVKRKKVDLQAIWNQDVVNRHINNDHMKKI